VSISVCADDKRKANIVKHSGICINWTAVTSSIILGLFSILLTIGVIYLNRTVDKIDNIEKSVISIQRNISSMTTSVEDLQKSQGDQFQILLKLLENRTK
jgi:hypothetical protein